MGKLYAKGIINDKYNNIDDIPTYWRAKTIQALEDMLASGEITQEQFDKAMGK